MLAGRIMPAMEMYRTLPRLFVHVCPGILHRLMRHTIAPCLVQARQAAARTLHAILRPSARTAYAMQAAHHRGWMDQVARQLIIVRPTMVDVVQIRFVRLLGQEPLIAHVIRGIFRSMVMELHVY